LAGFTLEAQLARLGEHERAVISDRFAKPDVVDAGDQPRERVSPLLERVLAEIVALEGENVEGDK
jgi:hypothetical protein